jgi:hypothetical protein
VASFVKIGVVQPGLVVYDQTSKMEILGVKEIIHEAQKEGFPGVRDFEPFQFTSSVMFFFQHPDFGVSSPYI